MTLDITISRCRALFAALSDIRPASVDGILSGKLATYRVVQMTSVRDLAKAGFAVLPTFGRPHMTVVLGGLERVGAADGAWAGAQQPALW